MPSASAGRLHAWTTPRIGILRQYDPKPLLVPEQYLLEAPPEPAPTISIVTPSYEQGRFLDRTLYSVASQGYPALEYVVQDGGSSDETLEVLRRYEPVLTRWASEPDEGQADAINRGFRNTTGEIMAWLNSDDLLLPGTLSYVARYFAEHPGVDVVYGNRLMIDENDAQIGAWILPAHDDVVLTYADFVPQETLFWRRRLWDSVGGSVDPTSGTRSTGISCCAFARPGRRWFGCLASSEPSGSITSRRQRPLRTSATPSAPAYDSVYTDARSRLPRCAGA